jgi:hypothetical protein
MAPHFKQFRQYHGVTLVGNCHGIVSLLAFHEQEAP